MAGIVRIKTGTRWRPAKDGPINDVLRQLSHENSAIREQARATVYTHFFPSIEQGAIRDFHLFRLLFEEVLGLPFTHLTPEDFVAEAKLAVLALLARATPFQYETLYRQTSARVRQMVAAQYRLPPKTLHKSFWLLHRAIREPQGPLANAPRVDVQELQAMLTRIDATKEIDRLRRQAHRAYPLPLEPSGGFVSRSELLGRRDPGPSGWNLLFRRERTEAIKHVVATLRPQAQQAVPLRHGLRDGEEWTLGDIGDEALGVSHQRVGEILQQADRELRRPARARALRPFWQNDGDRKGAPREVEPFDNEPRDLTPLKSRLKRGEWRPRPRDAPPLPLTQREERQLVAWLGRLSVLERKVLPAVVGGNPIEGQQTELSPRHLKARTNLLQKMRLALSTGALGRRPVDELLSALLRLATENGEALNGADSSKFR
ncbi:MAG: hypothetical protein ACKVPX_09305 [Myxococcaceae bacterium]